MMNPFEIAKKTSLLLAGLSLIWAVSGCRSPMVGSSAAGSPLALEAEGPHSGNIDTRGLKLQYTYTIAEAAATGKANMDLHLRIGYSPRNLNSLYVWANFLDAQGNLLQRNTLYWSGYRPFIGPKDRSVRHRLSIPEKATAMVFSTEIDRRPSPN
jgi:hypothetical protein